MRNTLYKRIPRDLKKNFVKYFGMIIILVCTISIGSAFQSTMKAAEKYLEDIREDNFQEDGLFEVGEPLDDEMLAILSDDGMWIEENFYATEREYADSTKVLLFNERSKIDIPVLFEGRMPGRADEIALDHVFAGNRGIKIGDTITLINREYTVCGTVSLPDYSSLFMNNTDLVMNTQHFCVSVLTKDAFDEIDDAYKTYRYSYRYTDRELSLKEKNDKAEAAYKSMLMNGVYVHNMLGRDQNQSISFLEIDIGTDGPFMNVFVYILVAMIAFIFAILTSNTIESESVIIGTLRSLGYKKSEIIWHYLQPTLIVAVVGSAIGNITGYTVMIKPFIDIYYTTYSIGPLDVEFDVPAFLLTTILPVVIMVFINCYMLARKLSLSPLRFLRKDIKKSFAKRNIKLPKIDFLNRFRLRVIIQNRGSYLMLFFGIFTVSFLLMFGMGLKPLLDHYTDEVDSSLPYEYQYILKAPVDTESGEKIMAHEMDTYFKLGRKDIGITLYGIDEDSRYFKDAYLPQNVAVSSALSNKLNIKVGDTINLTDSSTEKEYSFKVDKVFPYDAALSIFIDKSMLAEILEKDADSYNCILSGEKLDIDEASVVKVLERKDLLGATEQMMDSFSTVILFINIFSVVVYIVILYIMTRVVIEKNAISIAYMKVFGYTPAEIRKLYFTATTIVVILSLVVCIPLEIWMFKLVLVYLSSMIEGYISFYLPVRLYAEIVAIGIVAYLVINGLHIFTVKKIPMTDALKNRE